MLGPVCLVFARRVPRFDAFCWPRRCQVNRVLLLQFESYRLWDEIQANAGVRLLTTSGGIDIGPKTGRDMQSLMKACARHKIPITIYDPKRTLERFHVSIPDDNICVHQEDAVRAYCPRAGFGHEVG
jgi:hypothetical protein